MIFHVLLIEGDSQHADAVRMALNDSPGNQFQVEWVRTCALGLKRLARLDGPCDKQPHRIDAMLIDLLLPDVIGIETFDRLLAAMPEVPIIILSSLQDESIAKVAVQRGAQDYLLMSRVDKHSLPKILADVILRAAAIKTLFDDKERAQMMLNSIGDGVIGTNLAGCVTYMNDVAVRLTGWPRVDAAGHALQDVFKVINSDSRAPVPNPMDRATEDNRLVSLPRSCILIGRDGSEAAIEDSCAPIHDRRGQVTGAIMVFHDVSAARAVTRNLAYLAQHDTLTDLPNRALLNDRLTQAIMMAQRHHTAMAVLYLDLDRFKHINDSLGHLIGDRLLQSVALRLSECVRASDTVSRQGGDEFVILLPEIAHAQDAVLCAEKIIQAVKAPYVMDEHELYVTASVGIVIYPEDGIDVEALLQNADSAMYAAKDRGRNNYQFYRSDVNSKAIERQSLESGLRHAIQRHEFQLHYQPMVQISTGTIAGVEALIRWQHPMHGLVLPAQFISIAEESGLIVPMGQWVLREGCAQAKAWQDEGFPLLRLSVNISAVELRSKEFLTSVAKILKETGFDPKNLDLELTETFLMQDSKSTALVLRALKELGVHLVLDDFGTGYSSLSYMRRFPIDVLKVDRSFVRDLTTDEDDASVVSAVINMGKSLHMRVVAEGVETKEQLSFLQEHDCAEAQGYYFSRPLTADAFSELLHSDKPWGDMVPSPVGAIAARSNVVGGKGAQFPVPINEHERLEELYRYKLLDTPPEEFFDRLTQLAAQTCDVPIALISLVDRDRQWFKSRYGFAETQTPREQAFCAHTILGTEPFMVENAAIDPRFANNVLVRDEPGIRFYAAVPLITGRGFAIGSLCVIDRRPRTLTDDKLRTLQILANQVVQQIELREVAEMLRRRSVLLDKVEQTAQIGGWEIDLSTNALTWTPETYRIHGLTQSEYTPTVESAIGFYTPETEPLIRQAVGAAIAAAVRFDVELQIVRKDGKRRWVRAIGSREDEDGQPRRLFGVFQDIEELRRLESEIVVIAQREQTRIGLDLHDNLGQELTGISFIVSSLLPKVPPAARELRDEMQQVEGLLRGAIGTCRSVAQGLSPTGRESHGLISAIRRLAARIEKIYRIKISIRTQGRALSINDIVADHLYRIIQEAISNAIKHGPAQQIAVSIDWNSSRTLVSITNDATGVRERTQAGGMGLEIMRYRARLIGATLAMSRTAAGGTRVRCHLPNVTTERAKINEVECIEDSQ